MSATTHTPTVAGTYSNDTVAEVFVPQYLQGFQRSTPLKETNPLKDLQESIIAIPEGFFSEHIPDTPVNNSVMLSVVLILFLLFAFTFTKGIKYLGQMLRSLLNIKERQSILGDTTVRETQLRAVLLSMTIISEGFFIFMALARFAPISSLSIAAGIAGGAWVAFTFYYFQKWVYRFVGLLFTDVARTHKWLESFVSIQYLMGIPLSLVVLASIFIPAWSAGFLAVAAILYILSRILFIYKGFKIFYCNIIDLFYFIVYLCALEIAPLFWGYQYGVLIYKFVELIIIPQL